MRLNFSVPDDLDLALSEYEGKCAMTVRRLIQQIPEAGSKGLKYTRGAILPVLVTWALANASPEEILRLANNLPPAKAKK